MGPGLLQKKQLSRSSDLSDLDSLDFTHSCLPAQVLLRNLEAHGRLKISNCTARPKFAATNILYILVVLFANADDSEREGLFPHHRTFLRNLHLMDRSRASKLLLKIDVWC